MARMYGFRTGNFSGPADPPTGPSSAPFTRWQICWGKARRQDLVDGTGATSPAPTSPFDEHLVALASQHRQYRQDQQGRRDGEQPGRERAGDEDRPVAARD